MRVHHQKKLNKCIVSEGYVADEIITSAAGARIRVGNTDAEGRMAMGWLCASYETQGNIVNLNIKQIKKM